jgi:hypothetical protein
MSKTLAGRAAELADLMTLAGRIGAAPQLREGDGVWLVGPGGQDARRIGGSVSEAVAHLKRVAPGPDARPHDHAA